MSENLNFLQSELFLHPKMEVQDAVKFIYQGTFGGGHMIKDEAACLSRLKSEYENTAANSSAPVFQMLSENYARVNIAAVKGKISPETLSRIFILSSAENEKSTADFEENLAVLYDYFDASEISRYLLEYKSSGYPAVSHTETYRNLYAPAYRVISAKYIPLLPVFMAIDEKKPAIVGIDGRCGGGKTTYADFLQEVYACNLFRADDYFLPLEKRTPERLSSPGGNMDRERLCTEILLPLSKKKDVTYRKLFCGDFTYSDEIFVKYNSLNIIEGSYCLHPELWDYYDLHIFVDIDSETQLKRIEKRNGRELAEKFSALWIPLEEKYFEAFDVKSKCDVVVE